LAITVSSSSPELIPLAGIVLGGEGAYRTLTITPVSGMTGTTVITIVVSDGDLETSSIFLLTVAGNYISWGTDQGMPGASTTDDSDGDGFSNIVEYALGTNPTTASPSSVAISSNSVTYTKGTAAIANGDVSWAIENSETLDPGSWTSRVIQEAGDPSPTISYEFMNGQTPRQFFRLRVIAAP
ncbi:MAG: thrombospondin type 3 repeat-containing protein, partial [Luteolibacter sp.]